MYKKYGGILKLWTGRVCCLISYFWILACVLLDQEKQAETQNQIFTMYNNNNKQLHLFIDQRHNSPACLFSFGSQEQGSWVHRIKLVQKQKVTVTRNKRTFYVPFSTSVTTVLAEKPKSVVFWCLPDILPPQDLKNVWLDQNEWHFCFQTFVRCRKQKMTFIQAKSQKYRHLTQQQHSVNTLPCALFTHNSWTSVSASNY